MIFSFNQISISPFPVFCYKYYSSSFLYIKKHTKYTLQTIIIINILLMFLSFYFPSSSTAIAEPIIMSWYVSYIWHHQSPRHMFPHMKGGKCPSLLSSVKEFIYLNVCEFPFFIGHPCSPMDVEQLNLFAM